MLQKNILEHLVMELMPMTWKALPESEVLMDVLQNSTQALAGMCTYNHPLGILVNNVIWPCQCPNGEVDILIMIIGIESH